MADGFKALLEEYEKHRYTSQDVLNMLMTKFIIHLEETHKGLAQDEYAEIVDPFYRTYEKMFPMTWDQAWRSFYKICRFDKVDIDESMITAEWNRLWSDENYAIVKKLENALEKKYNYFVL